MAELDVTCVWFTYYTLQLSKVNDFSFLAVRSSAPDRVGSSDPAYGARVLPW